MKNLNKHIVRIALFLIVMTGMCMSSHLKAQIAYKQDITSRVDFREKMNRPAAKIPAMLLQAFCAGEIQAYFPNSPTTPMTYQDFLTHFGMAAPVVENKSDQSIACVEQSCGQLDPNILNCFSIYMDMDETFQFDRKHSQMKQKISYVRLVYSAECNYKGLDYEGPIFKVADMQKLSAKYNVMNPQNTAANHKLYTYFMIRPFNSVIIKEGEEYSANPAKKDRERKEKHINMEDSMYEH